MSTQTGRSEGIRRIAVVIAAIGWIWLVLFLVGAGSNLIGGRYDVAATVGIIGIVGFAVAKAVAWVISGFS